jgi:hypothetical protein
MKSKKATGERPVAFDAAGRLSNKKATGHHVRLWLLASVRAISLTRDEQQAQCDWERRENRHEACKSR